MLEEIMPARPFQTKEEYVYEALRTAILQCKLSPGERLVIDHLATTFGTSTIPIRSALQRLQAEGLVEIVPHAGAVVSEISTDMVTEIFAILAALESIAFEFAAQKVQDSDLVQLEGILEQMERAYRSGEIDRWSDLNGEFHLRVTQVTGMELLLEFTRRTLNYWGRVRLCYLKGIVSTRVPLAQAEHREMLELLKQRQGKELAVKVAQHNWRAREAYLSLIQSQSPSLSPESSSE